MHRRALVSALAAGAVAPIVAGGRSRRVVAAASARSSTPVAGQEDGLAHPIPMTPGLGVGKDRALVLSGGGIYMLAFHIAFIDELRRQGIDLSNADVVVGTSAGSIAGAVVTGGRIPQMRELLDAMGQFPFLFSEIIPPAPPVPSQLRASALVRETKVATAESTRAIGAAAMAAHNPTGPDRYHVAIGELLGLAEWPSPAMHTTANDCYTGERLVVSRDAGIPISFACAASASLPGIAGPTWLGDRLCMDGAISQSNTHCDVVAGARRALVIAINEGGDSFPGANLSNASSWIPIQEELDALEQGGTKTMLVVCGLPRGVTRIDSNMDPKLIAAQLKWGAEKARQEAGTIGAFWA